MNDINICRVTVRKDGIVVGVNKGILKEGAVYDIKGFGGMLMITEIGQNQLSLESEGWDKVSVDRLLATSGGRHLMVEGEK